MNMQGDGQNIINKHSIGTPHMKIPSKNSNIFCIIPTTIFKDIFQFFLFYAIAKLNSTPFYKLTFS